MLTMTEQSSATLRRIAGDIAAELDVAFQKFLNEADMPTKQLLAVQLKGILWDNKAGILRVLQAHAIEQRATVREADG